MTHYRALLDPGKFLGVQDFPNDGKEVTISRIAREKMPERKGEETQHSPMLYIKTKDGAEYPRMYKVPKSVLYGLSLLLGPEVEAWSGQKITLFGAECMSFGDREPCVRVRFTADIDAKIRKWMKKRGASASAYMLPPTTAATNEPTPENP